jgi:hypothetical protein
MYLTSSRRPRHWGKMDVSGRRQTSKSTAQLLTWDVRSARERSDSHREICSLMGPKTLVSSPRQRRLEGNVHLGWLVHAGERGRLCDVWAGHTSVAFTLDRCGHLFPGHRT